MRGAMREPEWWGGRRRCGRCAVALRGPRGKAARLLHSALAAPLFPTRSALIVSPQQLA